MTSTRTVLDVDIELSSKVSTRDADRWSKDRKVREATVTPDYRTKYFEKMNELLDERSALAKAQR